jgi:RNA polymerase sigma-70 factor (ECF subfamily)
MNTREPGEGGVEATPSSVSSSLLAGLRERDPAAWRRLVCLTQPIIRGWCVRAGLQPTDADDVTQEVFRALAGNVGRFQRGEGPGRSFRGWLWGVTRRQLLAHWRRRPVVGAGGTAAQQRFADLAEPPDDPSGANGPAELVRRAVTLLRAEVEERTWQAFWRTAVEGHAPADIAADLGLSVNAVYLAKARLLRRLRDEFGDLLT